MKRPISEPGRLKVGSMINKIATVQLKKDVLSNQPKVSNKTSPRVQKHMGQTHVVQTHNINERMVNYKGFAKHFGK